MENLTWQNPEQLFVAQELINKVKSKCCGIKVMNKISFVLAFIAMVFDFSFASAQKKVTIKSGTIVSLESVKEVRGAKAHEGETVDFKVVRDVIVDGTVAIPAGTIAKGTVYEANRSTAFGTRGRLGIKIKYLNTPSGEVVNFTSSDVYIKGSNRTAVSVVVFCFTLLPFPCGGKAVMPIGYETEATVAGNTTITVE